MHSFFGCLGKLIGACLVLLFVSIMPFSIWWINAQRAAFQPEIYIETFAENDVYENITPLVLPAIAETADQQGFTAGELQFGTIVENLDSDDWKAIASEVVPAEYLQAQAEPNLQRLFDYMNGDSVRLEVEFDTLPLRQNLLGQPGDRMVNLIFQSWADCTPEQEAQIVAFLNEEPVEFPYCKPGSAELQREVFTLLNDAKDELVSDIPERWNVREQYAERHNTTLQAADQRFYIDLQRPTALWNELVPLAVLLPCSLLALIIMFAVDSGKSLLRWMGFPLILTGLAVLLPLLFLPLLHNANFNDPTTAPTVDAIQAEALRGVFISVTSAFAGDSLIQGAILVGLGFFLLLISTVIPSDEEQYILSPTGSTGSYPAMPADSSSATVYVTQPTASVTPTPTPSPTPSLSKSKATPTPAPKRYRVQLEIENDEGKKG